MSFKKISLSLITLLLVVALSFTAMAEEVDLRIYHINDVHSRVEEGSYSGMGYAKISTLIDQGRKEKDNVLFLDAGDSFHGQIIANINEGESIAYLLNLMDLDALTLGNHDFNFGQDRLRELSNIVDFPLLAANLSRD
ncbi:MAG: metallophosphoesterase, partial [Halanaerobium sp.]